MYRQRCNHSPYDCKRVDQSFPGTGNPVDSPLEFVIQWSLDGGIEGIRQPVDQTRKVGRHMDFDVELNLTAVERSVTIFDRDERSASAVTLARSYATSIEDLWDAATNGQRIPRWFAPVGGDLELGGRYQVEGNAGGLVTACERLLHFALTWEFAGDVSWVEARFTDEGDRARVTLTHTAHLSWHWDRYGPGAAGVGWEMALLGLAFHIAQPDEPRPDEAEFATSRDGRAFITGSSDRWAQAAMVAGTEAEAAMAAARRSEAFYTGEPEPNA